MPESAITTPNRGYTLVRKALNASETWDWFSEYLTLWTAVDADIQSLEDAITFGVDPISITFDTTQTPAATPEGTIWWNQDEYTMNIETGLGPVIQVGHEVLALFYNNTGATIPNGSVVRPAGAVDIGGYIFPTPQLAQSNSHATCEGTVCITTADSIAGTLIPATRFGRVRGLNTAALSPAEGLWISPTVAGELTTTRPSFPDIGILMGGVLKSDPTDGQIFVSVTRDLVDIFNASHDGCFLETINFFVNSDGVNVTGSLSCAYDSGRDLTMAFSDGLFTLDTTPAATIALTPGTDVFPQKNYVYIPQTTKVLTVSTIEWPTTEHIRVALVCIQTAVTTQADGGALKNQNWNDHVKEEGANGHMQHLAYALREKTDATWKSGCEATVTVTPNGAAPDDIYVAVTGGKVMQLHDQNFPSFDLSLGDEVLVANDSVSPFTRTGNLNTLLTDSGGISMSTNTFSLVIWGVANKSTEPAFLFVNLPSSSYDVGGPFGISLEDAVRDVYGYSGYRVPDGLKGVAFLIARATFSHTTAAGGTWVLEDTEDLRGTLPNTSAGGGTGGTGATTYLSLTDTPASYIGNGGKFLAVTAGETGQEFVEPVDSAEITLTNATQQLTAALVTGSIDKTKLDASVNASLDLADSAIQPSDAEWIDLTDGLSSSAHYHAGDRNRANHTGTQAASTIHDFDVEVSNNADVTANTSARHVAVTVADTTEINMTLVGQQVSGSLVTSSVDETKLDASVNASLDLADSAVQPSDAAWIDLTDGGDSTAHYHAADRDRANHTGTQTASTISDFDTEVGNHPDVTANTAARHAELHAASHEDGGGDAVNPANITGTATLSDSGFVIDDGEITGSTAEARVEFKGAEQLEILSNTDSNRYIAVNDRWVVVAEASAPSELVLYEKSTLIEVKRVESEFGPLAIDAFGDACVMHTTGFYYYSLPDLTLIDFRSASITYLPDLVSVPSGRLYYTIGSQAIPRREADHSYGGTTGAMPSMVSAVAAVLVTDDENTAYVLDASVISASASTLRVYDISTFSSPSLLGSLSLTATVNDETYAKLGWHHGFLVLRYTEGGANLAAEYILINVSNPASMSVVFSSQAVSLNRYGTTFADGLSWGCRLNAITIDSLPSLALKTPAFEDHTESEGVWSAPSLITDTGERIRVTNADIINAARKAANPTLMEGGAYNGLPGLVIANSEFGDDTSVLGKFNDYSTLDSISSSDNNLNVDYFSGYIASSTNAGELVVYDARTFVELERGSATKGMPRFKNQNEIVVFTLSSLDIYSFPGLVQLHTNSISPTALCDLRIGNTSNNIYLADGTNAVIRRTTTGASDATTGALPSISNVVCAIMLSDDDDTLYVLDAPYTGAGTVYFRVYNISTFTSPMLTGSVQLTSCLAGEEKAQLGCHHGYICVYYSNGNASPPQKEPTLIDISTPASPAVVFVSTEFLGARNGGTVCEGISVGPSGNDIFIEQLPSLTGIEPKFVDARGGSAIYSADGLKDDAGNVIQWTKADVGRAVVQQTREWENLGSRAIETDYGDMNAMAVFQALTNTTDASSDSTIMTPVAGSLENLFSNYDNQTTYVFDVEITAAILNGSFTRGSSLWHGKVYRFADSADSSGSMTEVLTKVSDGANIFTTTPAFEFNTTSGVLEITVQHAGVAAQTYDVRWQCQVRGQRIIDVEPVC